MNYKIRDFQIEDSRFVNEIALKAFLQYKDHYSDWEGLSKKISNMSILSNESELIVGTIASKVIGAIAYVPAGKANGFFSSEWPAIRMLVVDPNHRGIGLGKALTEICVSRAIRDGASCIALHTSPIMKVALEMYLRMGFKLEYEIPFIHGVPYNIYKKILLNV